MLKTKLSKSAQESLGDVLKVISWVITPYNTSDTSDAYESRHLSNVDSKQLLD